MADGPIDRLMQIGFSEYEAKAYLSLLQKSPVSGYELSKVSGVPRSMIYEVAAKLTARGAAMTVHVGESTKYAPMQPAEYLNQLRREHEKLVDSLKADLTSLAVVPDMDYVWSIEGHENIMAKAIEMIAGAGSRIYLSLLPSTLPMLQTALKGAIDRGVRVVVYSPTEVDLPGGRVIVAAVPDEALSQGAGLGLVLVVDGSEVLIGEWSLGANARASWTRSPLFVFVAEHHLRTDLYLPQVLALLGDRARDLIEDEDWDIFACAMESQIGREVGD